MPKLLDHVRRHRELTIDVGHVSPGPAMILTGDPRAGDRLHRQLGGPWLNADVEQESSCGVIPIEYLPEKNLIAAVQWAIALEWYLLMDDPWRVALTSDHPNGGAFYRYPEMIYLLMDRAFRAASASPVPRLETNSVINLCANVRLMGLASIVPEYFLEVLGPISDVRAVPLVDPLVEHSVGLVAVDRDPVSPLVLAAFECACTIEPPPLARRELVSQPR